MHTFVELCPVELSSNAILDRLGKLMEDYERLAKSENEESEDEYFSNIVLRLKNLIDILSNIRQVKKSEL
jgi:hypothetical protein